MPFRFSMPVTVLFGERFSKQVGLHMKSFGMDNAMLVTDEFFASSGLASQIKEASGGRIIDIFSHVDPNPTDKNVEECIEFGKRINAKCMVALGGGSVMDCAKAAGSAIYEGVSFNDLLSGHMFKGMLPLLSIPTTAGTSSEMTFGCVISCGEHHTKRTLGGIAMRSTATIIDPELTYSCPPRLTASCGADVIAHAIDSMSSRGANVVTINLGIAAVKMAFRALPLAVKNGANVQARREMCEACVMAGMTFSQTQTAASHACSYELTAAYNVPHGEACAMTLDEWIRFNGAQIPALLDCAKALGYEDTNQLADALNGLFREIGLRRTLTEANIPVEAIEQLTKAAAASANMSNNAIPIKEEQIKNVLLAKL